MQDFIMLQIYLLHQLPHINLQLQTPGLRDDKHHQNKHMDTNNIATLNNCAEIQQALEVVLYKGTALALGMGLPQHNSQQTETNNNSKKGIVLVTSPEASLKEEDSGMEETGMAVTSLVTSQEVFLGDGC